MVVVPSTVESSSLRRSLDRFVVVLIDTICAPPETSRKPLFHTPPGDRVGARVVGDIVGAKEGITITELGLSVGVSDGLGVGFIDGLSDGL